MKIYHFGKSKKIKRLLRALITQGETNMAATTAQLTEINDKLTEASTEIVAKIEELTNAIQNPTPEQQALLDQISGKASSLADIVPNA